MIKITANSDAPPAPPPPDAAVASFAGPRFFNRELSWLDFNQRVLELAMDATLPLLERVRFLSIFSSNLDEFFMKRVGGLQRQRAAGVSQLSIDGLSVQQQLDAIHARVRPMLEAQTTCWLEDLRPAMAREGIVIREYDSLTPLDRAEADRFFAKHVLPVLTPLAVDPGHPFPFISNLSNSIGVILEQPRSRGPAFVRIKIPGHLPRWVGLSTALNFTPLEQLIGGNLSLLFPGMKVAECRLFRVTRNADIETDAEDADDLLQLVKQELQARRMAGVVRVELAESMSPMMRELVIAGIEVDPEDIYTTRGPIDLTDLFALANLDLPKLHYPKFAAITPPRLQGQEDIFSVIRQGDVLVHHPYESFAESVERFIADAAADPRTLAIKMTLYRTTPDSAFVPSLIRAAEMGKQVAVLVELMARFDEQRNLEIAGALEEAGVHVVYGVMGLKTHTKIAMVVRNEADGPRTYCHIGTGNYNSKTAQLYSDLGLFTCNPALCDDVIDLFHYLTGRSLKRDYRKLLVAPVNMRERFVSKIRHEAENARAGRPAAITAKMNALQDSQIITELYAASQAGVKIDLIIRGFCCLRPQTPGLSENIRVTSILGRYLEHSRIYRFANGGQEEYFIGSADWMNRNLDWRVEAITPIEDPALRTRLSEILELMLADRAHAWQLRPDGSWQIRKPDDGKPAGETQAILLARVGAGGKKHRNGR